MDITPVSRFIDGMVHKSVAGDRLSRLRHRDFITAHLLAGLVVLAAIPIWLTHFGPMSVVTAATFCWLLAVLTVAVYLSWTGQLEIAHLASAVVFAGFIVWLATMSGGMRSSVLAWLVFVPFEASLSGSRKVVASAVIIAVLGVILLGVAETSGLVSNAPRIAESQSLNAILVASTVVYAGSLIVRADKFARERAQTAWSSAERYRQLADYSTDLITRHSANGDVEFASPAVHALTGVDVADLLGEGLYRCVHVADRPSYLKALSEVYVTHQPAAVEFRLLQKSRARGGKGEAFVPVEMRCRPVIDRNGVVNFVVAVTRDITKRREREDELIRACEAADFANRAKTEFFARMSHELRTPLNAIIGFSQILEDQPTGKMATERRHEYARLIRVSGEHLLELVNGILDISKIESGIFAIVPEKVGIASLIDGCCAMLGQEATERGISIVREIPQCLPEISADIRACRQILLNLLSNAIKFTDRGGVIAVGASIENNMVALFVRDTGIGIAAEDLTRLGTPFVRAETVYGQRADGTGLGLSIVKGLATLHGGRLTIESAPGRGTTATALLPIHRESVEPLTGDLARPSSTGHEGKERKSA